MTWDATAQHTHQPSPAPHCNNAKTLLDSSVVLQNAIN